MDLFKALLVAALVGFAGLHAVASPSGVSSQGYFFRTWQTEDGLPQNSVTAITQTRDGYIWIGTYGGLARFDGQRFRVFDAGNTADLKDSRISCLFEDRDGGLLIGHESGCVTRYRDGKFEAFSRNTERGRISAIGADASGHAWLLRQSGALENVETNQRLGRTAADAIPTLSQLTGNAAELLWVATDGEAAELVDGKLQPIDFGPALRSGFVKAIGASSDGGFWVARDTRIRKWVQGRWTEDRGASQWGVSAISALVELRGGTVAVGTMDKGLYLMFADGRTLHFDHGNGLAQNWVRYLYEDREGSLWIGVGTGGITQVRPTPFTTIDAPDQWQGRTVLSVASGADGALWVGTEGAGLYRILNGNWAHFGTEEGVWNPFVWSLSTGAEGQFWAGTWRGLLRLEGNRFLRTMEGELSQIPVLALHYTPSDGALWVGTRQGLLRWKDDRATWAFRTAAGPANNVCTITPDRRGAIWFGLFEGGLVRLWENETTQFTKADGLASNSVQCLFADDDTLWIGTLDAGLSRLKNGKFASIGVPRGLASNVICHIADDGHGYLWLSTHHGIVRVAKSELEACADGRIATVASRVYDRNDGLPTIEYSGGLQSAGCQTADGRLWFTCSKGLVCVDPTNVRVNPLAPPVFIESLIVDGRRIEPRDEARRPIELAPNHQRIEFEYTGLSLAAPHRVLFKYRLEGLEESWSSADAGRTASYSRLPPGFYRFRVIACNDDHIWNTAGATFAFAVLPFYWQTWWFRTLVVVVALGVVGWSVRYVTHRRLQRRVEQLEQERAIDRERARIAQDIHDEIGASLTRISLLSQTLPIVAEPPPQAAAMLERIHTAAREVTQGLDEIVWSINPRHDSLESLVGYIGKFAQHVLAAAGVRCRLDLVTELPEWTLTAQARHNLLLTFKEALNNAVRHAHATEVNVALTASTEELTLTVTDNGRGFDFEGQAGSVSLGGNGLSNMRRRMAQLHGCCHITTRPAAGTQVSLVVPRQTNETPQIRLPS